MKRKVVSLDRYRLGKRPNYESRFRELMRAELKKLIEEAGWSQLEAQEQSGVTQSTLSPQLDGTRQVTLETLDKIAIARGKSVAQVIKQMSDLALEIPSATARPAAAIEHYQAETPKKSRAQLRREQKAASDSAAASSPVPIASTGARAPSSQGSQPRPPSGTKPRP